MWLIFAFSGPILWALSTHLDKYLIERYFKDSDTAVFMVFTAFIGLIMLPFIWFFQSSALMISVPSIIIMIISGILYMSAMLFYLKAIQSADASVVGPLFQTMILFTFILGYIVLGETISGTNALGVGLIVFGAITLSLDKSFKFKVLKMRTLFMMLVCTFILASSNVAFKYFAIQENFWTTTFWMYVGEALFGVGILLVPKYYKQFIKLFKENTKELLAINATNELINLGGGLGVRFASLFAPVVLVSAISSTSTLFIFIFGFLFTIFFPKIVHEDISKRTLLKKGIATVLITIGVFLTQI